MVINGCYCLRVYVWVYVCVESKGYESKDYIVI